MRTLFDPLGLTGFVESDIEGGPGSGPQGGKSDGGRDRAGTRSGMRQVQSDIAKSGAHEHSNHLVVAHSKIAHDHIEIARADLKRGDYKSASNYMKHASDSLKSASDAAHQSGSPGLGNKLSSSASDATYHSQALGGVADTLPGGRGSPYGHD